MNKEKELFENEVEDIQKICFNKIRELLTSDQKKDSVLLNDELKKIMIAARMINNYQIMKRINQGQQIRIFSLITSDEAELKRYVEISMPQTIPFIEKQ